MTDRAKERDLRYHKWLDEIVEHLRESRRQEAAEVINGIPDEEVRNFALYLALHVDQDLDAISRQASEHAKEIHARDTPSEN